MGCEKFDSLTLLSYIAGDLSDLRRTAVRQHLEHCTRCSDFVASMEKEQAAFLGEFPSAPPVNVHPVPLLRFKPVVRILSVAAVLVLALGTGTLVLRQPHDGYRTKGGVALELFVSDSSGHPSVRKETVFFPGERIQFTYSCGKERYFILVSVDETGKVSVFYPASGDRSMLLEPGTGLPLPHSILLDGYIGLERYVAVYSEHPLPVAAVVDEVKRAAAGPGGLRKLDLRISGGTVCSVLLTKRQGP